MTRLAPIPAADSTPVPVITTFDNCCPQDCLQECASACRYTPPLLVPHKWNPPSTVMIWPTIQPASSRHSIATTSAASSTVVVRPQGETASSFFIPPSKSGLTLNTAVLMSPGRTQLTTIPYGANS